MNDNREEFIDNMRSFITEQEEWLIKIQSKLNWNPEYLEKIYKTRSEMVCCPIKAEHRMPAEYLSKHIDKCDAKYGKHPEVDLAALESLSRTVQPNVVFFEILIRTSLKSQATAGLIVEPTIADLNLEESMKNKKSSSANTLAELLAAERDAKRRRIAHRGRRVRSKKKTYSEVLKELIESQMGTLKTASNHADSVDKQEMKDNIEANVPYIGIGTPYYDGNPHKRWITIKDEEDAVINRLIANERDDRDSSPPRSRSRRSRESYTSSHRYESHTRRNIRSPRKYDERSRSRRSRESYSSNQRYESRTRRNSRSPRKYDERSRSRRSRESYSSNHIHASSSISPRKYDDESLRRHSRTPKTYARSSKQQDIHYSRERDSRSKKHDSRSPKKYITSSRYDEGSRMSCRSPRKYDADGDRSNMRRNEFSSIDTKSIEHEKSLEKTSQHHEGSFSRSENRESVNKFENRNSEEIRIRQHDTSVAASSDRIVPNYYPAVGSSTNEYIQNLKPDMDVKTSESDSRTVKSDSEDDIIPKKRHKHKKKHKKYSKKHKTKK